MAGTPSSHGASSGGSSPGRSSSGRVSIGRRAARAGWITTCLALTAAVLAACNMTSMLGQSGNEPPDAMDRVRATNLEPRFPAPEATVNTGPKSGARASSYYGTAVPEVAAVVPTASGGGEGFELNFENTPVATVAKVILGDILGLGYTIDPRVQGTISLASGRPVPKGDILFVLENALRASNVALVRETAGYRLVPAAEAVGSGNVDHAVDGNRPEAGYGVTAIPLQHASVQTVTKLLDTFAMKAGSIRSDPARNILIVLGTGAERRAAVETVLSFDTDWMRGQSVGIYPVHNSPPESMITELEKIMDSGDGGLGQGMVKFQAVSRLNAILVVSRKPEFLRTAATWISRLDNSELASTGVKVYRVRYGDARQLARLLNEVFVGGSAASSLDSAANQLAPGGGSATLSSTERLTGGAGSPTTSGLPTPTVSAGPSGASGALGGSGSPLTPGSGAPATFASRASAVAGGFGESLAGSRGAFGAGAAGGTGTLTGVRITPDVINNALLIYASADNYRIIERTLSQLDRPPLQVAIDLTIAEVTLNDQLNYGVQFFLESAKLGFPIDSGSVINSAAGAVLGQTLPGFNLLVGNAALPRLVINALHDFTDVRILSNPSLVVVDNQSATLQVGNQVPITTGSATVLSTSNTVVNTISYQNTGIILHVAPRINSNGRVLLDVEQEISSVDPTSATGTLTPTLTQRKVKSTISIMNGQTVLLAGLISDSQSRSRNGIPGLDQLPAIADVFTQNQKQIQRTELIIFIRPQIIRDGVDAAVVAEELRSKMKGSKIGSVTPPGAVAPRAPRIVQ
jgi:general secretion pathway protein D